MSQQYPGATGRSGAPRPDGSQQPGAGQWEDEWDDDYAARRGAPPPPWPAQPGAPWPPPPPPGGQGSTLRSRIRPVTAGVIAVIAALVVAVVVLFAVNGHSAAPAPAAGAGNAPAGGGAPAQGGGGPVVGGGGGGGNHLFLAGQVIKVSSTSITLSAQGRDISAAITSSTRFTGSVKNASGIKPGQSVVVVISGYGSAHPVAQSISDPPSMP